jgi:DNA invertase Pin-like site-specific DNA recombinase
MLIGYGRTSTREQVAGLQAQERDLKAKGCEKLFLEQLSSVDENRKHLNAAIEFCREGDTLVCTKLDRLARSVADLVKIEERLKAKGVALLIMDPAMNTSTPTGRLMFNVIASIAQFEREIMLTRQREGLDKAIADGLCKGRKPTVCAKADEIRALQAEGLGPSAIARQLKVSRRSIYNVLALDLNEARSKVANWNKRKAA